ncbi:DNA-binding barrel domain superfamily [Sesbania bispinosa]|nr:DNA-binding barrel domain superfamily [Sesbania bispinosa]
MGPGGLGDIQYPHDPEEVLGVPGGILWTTLVSRRQLSGRHGLVLPVRIVNGYLVQDQREIQIKIPNGQIQSLELVWNTQIRNHCRIGQGWYQYCRAEELQEGDELMFWLLDGEGFIRLVSRRHRD